MTLRDRYKKLKKKYPNSVVLIKSGSFYNTYEDDAILIHELLGYRLVNKRVGFPIYNLYKINVNNGGENVNQKRLLRSIRSK